MKPETKEVIAAQFHQYINDSKRSQKLIGKALGIPPTYLSALVRAPTDVPETSMIIMNKVLDECSAKNWNLDQYLNKKGRIPPISIDKEQLAKDSQKAEQEIQQAASNLKDAVGREPTQPDLSWMDELGTAVPKTDYPQLTPVLHGWVCPVCGRGNSPYTTTCLCIPHQFSVT